MKTRTLAALTLIPWSVWAGDPVPFTSERWELGGTEIRTGEHLDRTALYVKNGRAVLNDVELTDGTIEFDLAVSGERGFMGGVWRFQDPNNFEEFYIRPHQSGNPDANQYTPVFHATSAWQLYHGPGYGAPVEYPTDQWIPIRIVFAGPRADVYVGVAEQPQIQVRELKHPVRPGRIGVINPGNFTHAWFSNFRYSAEAPITEISGETPVTPPGTVTRWQISNAFPEASLKDVKRLGAAQKGELKWVNLEAESTGITNLARIQGIEGEANMAFARFTVEVDTPQVRRLHFGYSDRTRLYLNDRLLYAGDNTYRTRDYRYLGTIGTFDSVYLDLEAGSNEVWIAVAESFGGWGVIARLNEAP